MQQFSLQRLEEGLNLGVVGALTGSVHAVVDLVLFEQCLSLVGPVFDPPISMKQQASGRISGFEGLSQSGSGEIRVQALAQSPTEYSTREKIQNHRQENVFLTELDVGHVTAPLLIHSDRGRGFETIIGQRFQFVTPPRQAPVDVGYTGPHSPLLHHLCNPVFTHCHSLTAQRLMDPRTAVASLAIIIDPSDLGQQRGSLCCSFAGLSIGPGIVAGTRNAQVLTKGLYAVLSSVFPDEPERFRRSSA